MLLEGREQVHLVRRDRALQNPNSCRLTHQYRFGDLMGLEIAVKGGLRNLVSILVQLLDFIGPWMGGNTF